MATAAKEVSDLPSPSPSDDLGNGDNAGKDASQNANNNEKEATDSSASTVELQPSVDNGSKKEDKNENGSALDEIDENAELTANDTTGNDGYTIENGDASNKSNDSNEDEKENANTDDGSGSGTGTAGNEQEDSIGSGNLGYDDAGKMLPAFENVDDELLSFNSESDFAIFQKQLNGDIPLQRLVAVKRMVAGCPRWGTDAALSLIDRFSAISNDKELVIRQTIAEQLGPFAKYLIEATNNSPRAHKIVIEDLLPLMKDMLRDAGEIRQGAGNSLIMIAELLTEVEVHEHVLKIVLHMAHDDSDDQKITALPLLADLAPIVGHSVCRNYLSSDLNALSQDNSFRVRKSTVQYFGPICEQLGADDVEKALLPVFQQLCQDSIWSVRKGCVESFVDVANSVHQETRGKLIPIMEKFLNDSSRWVRNAAYEHLGPFLSVLTSEQIKPELVKYFVNIPNLSSAEADADCSNHCAFNFPAVAQTLGPDRWDELNDLYNILVRKTFKSRKTLACSIHEICKILGTERTERYLMSAIEFFLKDIDDIREGIIKNLWKLLAVFNEQRRQEYISQLWDLASESDVNWRFRLLLAQQLEEVIPLYPPKVVYEQFVPLTFQLCNDRMADVRYAAVDPVKDLIDCFSKAGQRESIDGVIKKCNQIRDGKTYAKRLLYIRICSACVGKIDKDIYDQHFYSSVLTYADDKIMNVRYCLSRFLKAKIYSDESYRNRDDFKKTIEKLKNDPEDVEVRRFFSTEDEIEKFLRSYKTAQPSMARPPNAQTMAAADDMDDSDSSLYSTSDDEMGQSTTNGASNGSESNTADGTGDGNKEPAAVDSSAPIGNGKSQEGESNDKVSKEDSEKNDETEGKNDNREENEAGGADGGDGGDDGDGGDNDENDKNDDSSSDSYEDEEDDASRYEARKLTKKLSKIDLEHAQADSNNPENAKGTGPDIADIGPDGRLVHQPTPFRLTIPDDDDDDDEDNDENEEEKNNANDKNGKTDENSDNTENNSNDDSTTNDNTDSMNTENNNSLDNSDEQKDDSTSNKEEALADSGKDDESSKLNDKGGKAGDGGSDQGGDEANGDDAASKGINENNDNNSSVDANNVGS